MRSITLSLSSPSTLVATTLTSPYHSDFHFDLSLTVQNPVFVVTLSFCVNTIWIFFQFKMTSKEEFRAFAHAMVDYIIDYHENIKSRSVYISSRGHDDNSCPFGTPLPLIRWFASAPLCTLRFLINVTVCFLILGKFSRGYAYQF